MKEDKKELVAQETLKWCLKTFGNPLKKKTPFIKFVKDRRFKKFCGEYYCKEITIYGNVCKSTTTVVKTVIHEFMHFLQMPRNKDMEKYAKLQRKYDYRNNPYEIEAFSFEKEHYKACKEHLKLKGVI